MYFLKKLAPSAAGRGALALTMVFSLPVAVAQNAPTEPSAVVARGPAGIIISVNDVLSELLRAPPADRKAVLAKPEALQQLAANLLVRRTLAAEAERDALGHDPVVVAALTVARDRVLSDARLVRLDAQNAPSDAAIDAYARNVYQANAASFEKPAQTHAHHILLSNKGPESLAKAQALVVQLRAGASFEELAKANSIDSGSAAKGGDLGFFGAGKMVRPFEDAVNALAKPGDISDPVETQFGYHIIRLDERREKSRQTYEEVRSQLIEEARTAILNDLRLQKVRSMSQDFVFVPEAIEAMGKRPPL